MRHTSALYDICPRIFHQFSVDLRSSLSPTPSNHHHSIDGAGRRNNQICNQMFLCVLMCLSFYLPFGDRKLNKTCIAQSTQLILESRLALVWRRWISQPSLAMSSLSTIWYIKALVHLSAYSLDFQDAFIVDHFLRRLDRCLLRR